VALCSSAQALEPFTPLLHSATLADTNEDTDPFLLPAGWVQDEVVDVGGMNALFGGAYPATFRAWDMLDIRGVDSEFLYIPHEVQTGAGVTRFDRDLGDAVILIQGNDTGVFDADPTDGWDHQADDFGAGDGIADSLDNGPFRAAFGSASADADFDANGVVDQLDAGIFRARFGRPPGPARESIAP